MNYFQIDSINIAYRYLLSLGYPETTLVLCDSDRT